MIRVSSWGRLSSELHHIVRLDDRGAVAGQLRATPTTAIPHGMGKSYGDACLNPGGYLWLTTGLNRFISFDDNSGRLVCEAGVLLRDIQRLLIPRGWILPVTPGTQLITVGGAIANDVHGKNHHVAGCFGDHVLRLRLFRSDGEIIDCAPDLRSDWFSATVGGLGLTGLITEVEIQLRRVNGPWLDTDTVDYESVDAFSSLADTSEAGWEYTVSWIDCIGKAAGRGIFMRANHGAQHQHAEPAEKARAIPATPPVSLVNGLTLPPFNALYFHSQKRRSGPGTAHYRSFFYPLDHIRDWNRMYGPCGFYQYQSVVPRAGGNEAVKEMLAAISRAGEGSFLAVLKTFGQKEPLGMLSFPRPGITLALDFPNRGECTLKLFERLDAIVRTAGGRLYMAKDARMPRELFERGYPRLGEFLRYRDPGISSGLSRRLMGV